MVTLDQRALFYANAITAFTGRPKNYSWLAGLGSCLRARVAESNITRAQAIRCFLHLATSFPEGTFNDITGAPHWRTDRAIRSNRLRYEVGPIHWIVSDLVRRTQRTPSAKAHHKSMNRDK
jgi:hypothetical protein